MAQPPEVKSINRREFLNYVWGASIALLIAEAGGTAVWFALPHYQYGPESGLYRLTPEEIPAANSNPAIDSFHFFAKFWLRRIDQGIMAFSVLCPKEGCRFVWVGDQFVCPCCDTKFTRDGDRYYGLAKRNLDRYPIKVITPDGIRQTPADGSPVSVEGATEIIVDTRFKILGQALPQFPG